MKWQHNKDFLLSLPLPEETESYKPVPHSRFIQELRDRIVSQYKIKAEKYLCNKDGSQLNVKFILDDEESPLFYKTITGINSYNKSLACRVISGSTCNNMIHSYILESYTSYHRHTKSVHTELDKYFLEITMNLNYEIKKVMQFKELTENINLSMKDVSYILGKLFLYNNSISPTQLSAVKKLHDEKNIMNLWDLINHTLRSYEEFSHSSDYISNVTTFLSYIKDLYNITLENEQTKLIFNEPA